MIDRAAILTSPIVLLFASVQTASNFSPIGIAENEVAYFASDVSVVSTQPASTQVSVNRARDGLFHITALINGHPVDMAIDTGATRTILAKADAAKIGLTSLSGSYSNMETLNGRVRLARTNLQKLTIGNRELTNLEVVLGPHNLRQSVIGLDAIGRSGPILIESERLTLLAEAPQH
ncbi:MAG: retropepsin-like aspartic protease [Sphingorhabdus sp.]